jgi:hypothetical protein
MELKEALCLSQKVESVPTRQVFPFIFVAILASPLHMILRHIGGIVAAAIPGVS